MDNRYTLRKSILLLTPYLWYIFVLQSHLTDGHMIPCTCYYYYYFLLQIGIIGKSFHWHLHRRRSYSEGGGMNTVSTTTFVSCSFMCSVLQPHSPHIGATNAMEVRHANGVKFVMLFYMLRICATVRSLYQYCTLWRQGAAMRAGYGVQSSFCNCMVIIKLQAVALVVGGVNFRETANRRKVMFHNREEFVPHTYIHSHVGDCITIYFI